MEIFERNDPLTEDELDRLDQLLESCEGGVTMNIEELDGFLAALIASPDVVLPSEYLPEIFGGEMSEAFAFESIEEASDLLSLILRHWNEIASTLSAGEIYMPLLLEDEDGVAQANDWARGFIRGTNMRHDDWVALLDDENQGAWMLPMLMLYHEQDEDPTMRPEPIDSKKREDIIAYMAAGLLGAYRYFRQYEKSNTRTRPSEPRPSHRKIGRNEPCPCGSGKKYKHCCGSMTVH